MSDDVDRKIQHGYTEIFPIDKEGEFVGADHECVRLYSTSKHYQTWSLQLRLKVRNKRGARTRFAVATVTLRKADMLWIADNIDRLLDAAGELGKRRTRRGKAAP